MFWNRLVGIIGRDYPEEEWSPGALRKERERHLANPPSLTGRWRASWRFLLDARGDPSFKAEALGAWEEFKALAPSANKADEEHPLWQRYVGGLVQVSIPLLGDVKLPPYLP